MSVNKTDDGRKSATIEDIASHRDDLKSHFKEEFKLKAQVNTIEKEIENENLSLQNKKAELSIVIRERGGGNIQVKIINEEIDEVN